MGWVLELDHQQTHLYSVVSCAAVFDVKINA